MPLLFEALPLHPVLPPGGERLEEIVVHLRAAGPEAGDKHRRPRLCAVLVLDISASMKGEPLAQVVRSAERLVEILGPEDKLGVVAFDQAAHTVVPIRPLSAENRLDARQRIRRLRAGHGTNISAGLAHAALLFSERQADERQLLLLLSDGQPSVGTRVGSALAEEVWRIRSGRGISVSTLGYGEKHSEDILLSISDAGGGRYAFVGDPLLADTSFARAVGTQLDVVAEDVHLLLRAGPGGEIVRVLSHPQATVTDQGLRVSLQDVAHGEERHLVVELRLKTPKVQSTALGVLYCPLKATLSCKKSGAAPTAPPILCHDEVTITLGPEELDERVLPFVLIGRVEQRRAEARGLADRRDFSGAAAVLKEAVRALGKPYPKGAKVPPLITEALALLADEIRVMEQQPSDAEYRQYRKASMDHQALPTGTGRAPGSVGLSKLSGTAQQLVRKTLGGAPVRARLEVLEGQHKGKIYEITEPEVDIGRTGDNAIPIDDMTVSRRHAQLLFKEGAFHIVDLGSSYGLKVNGKKVSRHQLVSGDVIHLGQVRLRFHCE